MVEYIRVNLCAFHALCDLSVKKKYATLPEEHSWVYVILCVTKREQQ